MNEREKISQAINELEQMRLQLGDRVVDITVASLHEKLSRLGTEHEDQIVARADQRKQVTILFANLVGFSEISEKMPDTAMLNLIDLLWSRLDSVLTSHEGIIDKHMGDAVMGLFGVPVVREDDPVRAVHAAVGMRAALNNFIADFLENEKNNETSEFINLQQAEIKNLRIRIGINTGPVMLGGVGVGQEYTVIGDAVNIASRLEKTAPDGGILIAHDTYQQVKDKFNVEPLGPVTIRGRAKPVDVYLVLGSKPRHFYEFGRGLEGIETKMIGRNREMGMLRDMLRATLDSGIGRNVRILGEAGVGKSRLVHEFSNWVRQQSEEILTLKARTYQQSNQMPYALVRDMLATHYSIQDNEPAALAEQKLVSGMARTMVDPPAELRAKAQAIGQLIGLEPGPAPVITAIDPEESLQFREKAYDFIVELLESILNRHDGLLIFLEDTHWADESSIDLMQYISRLCLRAPLMIISMTRPSGIDLFSGTSPFNNPDLIITLKTLSPQKSRELVQEILQKLPEIPDDLADLIVNRAEGNPFFVEELIKILIEDGVIIAGEKDWRLRTNQLKEVRVPPHISGVLQARLDRLAEPERIVLQRAAVLGRVFWDTAVFTMQEEDNRTLSQSQTVSALQSLEKRELIFPREISGFAGAQAYVFKHALLAQVTYESILLRQRPQYHHQVAEWYAAESGERIAEYAGIIAEHFELAGENKKAAELFELAANRALGTYNITLAMNNFRKSLSLLADKSHYAVWQIRLQGELGGLLMRQARLVEAAQTFILMRFTAEDDGDLAAQARAWNGLALVQQEQADFTQMLHSAGEGERVAWLISAENELVRALMNKSLAHIFLGQEEEALTAVDRALEMSERLPEPELFAQALYTYCQVLLHLGRYEEVEQKIAQLEIHISLQEMLENESRRANALQALGKLLSRLGKFDQAGRHLLVALNLFRRQENQTAISYILYSMGETARLQGNPRAAIPLYRKALSLANSTGDRYGTLQMSINLGAALLELGSYEVAQKALLQVSRLTENISRMASWVYKPQLFAYLGAAELGLGNRTQALHYAKEAVNVAREMIPRQEGEGIAWRNLAIVLAQLPPAQLPYHLQEEAVEAADCFQNSLRVFSQWAGGGVATYPEQIKTLTAWAAFESDRGNETQAAELNAQAKTLASPLNIQANPS